MVLSRLGACTTGAVAVLTAMVLPVLLGFISLGTEVGHWYLAQREMQGAADAAAISAAAEYIHQYVNNGGVVGSSYQTVGVNYASLNGFTIPSTNVCAITSATNNCSLLQIPFTPSWTIQPNYVYIVSELVQYTSTWMTTKVSVEPGHPGPVKAIPTPTLVARSVVSIRINPGTAGTPSETVNNCILALANNPAAVQVSGSGADLHGSCGVAIDNGGQVTLNGSGAKVQIQSLNVAASSAGSCPSSNCQTPSGSTLPTCPVGTIGNCIATGISTPDPYTASLNFTNPLGVATATRVAQGSGYTNGTRTFTLACSPPNCTAPAKFTVTVSGGKVTSTTATIIDPGAYTVFPTGAVTGTPDTGGGSGATFTLTQGCFNQPSTIIPGRTYCSINLSGNFPPGNYYTVGNITGSGSTGATAVSSGTTPPGVTFFQTSGTISITGNATYKLCAPGTVASGHQCDNTATTCNTAAGSCMLFIQSSNAGATTQNNFAGGASSVLSGVVYLPNETYRSGGSSAMGGCFGVVAQYVLVQGTPTFSNGCLPGGGIPTTIPGNPGTPTTLSSPLLFQ